MKYLLSGFSGGFGRVFGRIVAYFIIGFVIYSLLKYYDIDISKYIKILRGAL